MVIRLYCDTDICITTQDYDDMVRELEIKKFTGTLTKGDSILATVLHNMNWRYCEILHKRKMSAVREECERNQANGHGHCHHTPADHEELGWTCDYWPIGGPCCGRKS